MATHHRVLSARTRDESKQAAKLRQIDDRMCGPRLALNFLQPRQCDYDNQAQSLSLPKKEKEETEESRHPCPYFLIQM